jgi:capsular polysaccharide biosynthesis protein
MSAQEEPRPVRAAPAPEDEREIDFGRLGRSILRRWWLVVAAVLLGALAGYLTSLGGGEVYVARTTVYLGQPLSPTGNAQIQSLGTNPATVSEIVRSDEVVDKVASELDIRPARLRAGISTRQIIPAGTTAASRVNQNPLVQISVRGPWEGDTTAQAANALADAVVTEVSGYVDAKIAALEQRLDSENRELAQLDRRIDALSAQDVGGLTSGERLILIGLAEQRRGQLVSERTDTEQLLTLAQTVERGKQVTEAKASKVPAQSPRSAIVVGALIGLLVGLALALLWEPLFGRRRPASA